MHLLRGCPDRKVHDTAHLMCLLAAMSLLHAGSPTVTESNKTCTREHCFHAFDALYCDLTGSTPIPPSFPDEKFPLFVTWNVSRPGRAPKLRGCIGNFEPMLIRQGIAEYALVSAFNDSRFRKIEEKELSSLECGISLLTDFENAQSYLDWTVGVHGIHISFPNPSIYPSTDSSAPSPLSSSAFLPRFTSKPTLSATYLPHVMVEQGWDKIEAIDSAIRKAGWNGNITEGIRRSISLQRYQSRKCMVGWDEFIQWRKDNGDKDI